jgi:hypothetical protein
MHSSLRNPTALLAQVFLLISIVSLLQRPASAEIKVIGEALGPFLSVRFSLCFLLVMKRFG